tara:strand:- start:219 stop:917 length:699 start_codon:yes stop_codon:yes gene_type:complete
MKLIKVISLLTLIAFSFHADNEDYDVKIRIALKATYHNYTFYNLLGENQDYTYGGVSQQIKGMLYLDELDKDLKEKLINKAPKNTRKHIKKIGVIAISASNFIKPYGWIPKDFSYQKNTNIEFLYLNWPYFSLGLGPIAIDISFTSLYLNDKINFNKGKLKARPSFGVAFRLSDLSFSKKFPISFDIDCNYRYLFPLIQFYEGNKFNKISSEPSITLNLKIPIEIPVNSNKL